MSDFFSNVIESTVQNLEKLWNKLIAYEYRRALYLKHKVFLKIANFQA